MKKLNVFWFRRDLRLKDNAGLYHALRGDHPVLPIFIFDPHILKPLPREDARVQFIFDELQKMKETLRDKGSDLWVLHLKPNKAWQEILQKYDVQKVFSNEDYEPYARERDLSIAQQLKKKGISFESFKDQCIFAKNEVLKDDGDPYTVYTPYKNKWYQTLTEGHLKSFDLSSFEKNYARFKAPSMPTLKEMGFAPSTIQSHVSSIKKKIIENYHETRETPSIMGTTHLGIHLRFGTVSVRKCARLGRELNRTWLDELVWREFFMQILYHFPYVVNAPFREKYEQLQWINDREQFERWCQGKTGFPLVDAGMRELNETGFMHNRVRMLTASFLVKDLLIDWRWGERYFAEKLLDFELASNNGNWQWAAGTGCDAAPYFRIFNPHTQLKKFDPELKYVKKWIPEYGSADYPKPMIDHKMAYHRALKRYKAVS